MTPSQAIELARQSYNAVGDTYWSDAELLGYAYMAELELNREGLIIERTMETDTVIAQREYDKPTNCIQIKRIEYNGKRVSYVNFDKFDELTGYNSNLTSSGEPRFYTDWDNAIMLYPTPDAVGTLEMKVILEPTLTTVSGTFLIETQFHPAIVNYMVWRMVIKDSNNPMADRYYQLYSKGIADARQWKLRKRAGDRLPVVGSTLMRPWAGMG